MFWAETRTLVSRDLDLDWLALAKISMLRLNIGSGMLRLSSCMLSICHGSYFELGHRGLPPCLEQLRVHMANAEHGWAATKHARARLNLNRLISAKNPEAALP